VITAAFLADVVAVIHALFSAFIVGGCIAFPASRVLRWRWASGIWLRAIHLACIGFVALRTWIHVSCPLNVLEMHFRDGRSSDGALARCCHWIFFKSVDPRQFAACLTALTLVMLGDFLWSFRRVE
jgi:hypothetical protein